MKTSKKIVIVGATSAIAEHCARLWVEQQTTQIILIGRDLHKMQRISADLQTRSPHSHIQSIQADFLNPTLIQKTVDDIMEQGPVDIILIAHGFLPEQHHCQSDLALCRDTLEINAISPVLYAEAFAKYLEKQQQGTLGIIGSVAGDRGRRSIYVYGAAKSLVSHYAAGLKHRFAHTNVKIVLIKPGPTHTPMTTHLLAEGKSLAPVTLVAKQIVDAMQHGKTVLYTPTKWRLIMWVVRHMPAFIFNKINI